MELSPNSKNCACEQISFTIIMAYFRTDLKLVEDAFASLGKQTYSNFELIVVDDCSSGEKNLQLQAMVQNQPFSGTYIHLPANNGPSVARNKAIELAQGDYCLIFDSDDILAPQTIQLFAVEANNNPALIFSDHVKQNFALDKQLQKRTKSRVFQAHMEYKGTIYDPLLHFLFSGPAQAFAKDALREVRGYDPNLRNGEDWDIVDRVSLLSKKVNFVHIPQICYTYRDGPMSLAQTHKKRVSEGGIDRVLQVAQNTLLRRGINFDRRFRLKKKIQPEGYGLFGMSVNDVELKLPYLIEDEHQYIIRSDDFL